MPRINLLPWRETQRQERVRKFKIASGAAAVAALGVIILANVQIEAWMSLQRDRNQVLQDGINQVKGLIGKKKKLEEEEKELKRRIQIIERLQLSRPLAVHLFDALARTTPSTVYILNIAQSAEKLKVQGNASSPQAVSEYMRNLYKSPSFDDPQLLSITGTKLAGNNVSRFELSVTQVFVKQQADAGKSDKAKK